MKLLTAAQIDGRACVVCGSDQRPMVPVGCETRTSSEVFRCDAPVCMVTLDEVAVWITENGAAPRVRGGGRKRRAINP